jgi:hypothetical protein
VRYCLYLLANNSIKMHGENNVVKFVIRIVEVAKNQTI